MLERRLSVVCVKAEPLSPTLSVGADDSLAAPPTGDAVTAAPVSPAVGKRPRGRPRKHPKPDPDAEEKKIATKARSKTGCITCRRRKKKCDEAKPICRSCESGRLELLTNGCRQILR
jgi:hypothetical protein